MNMDEKQCKKCLNTLKMENFYRNLSYKDGFSSKCKACVKKYYEKRSDHFKAYQSRKRLENPDYFVNYRKTHKDSLYQAKIRWQQDNPDKVKNQRKKDQELFDINNPDYFKNYRKNNKEIIAIKAKNRRMLFPEKGRFFAAKRRADRVKATPSWINLEEIKKIYKNCPEGYHVDHIIPLNHKLVCGLHVPWNLQYLPAEENLKKSNKI